MHLFFFFLREWQKNLGSSHCIPWWESKLSMFFDRCVSFRSESGGVCLKEGRTIRVMLATFLPAVSHTNHSITHSPLSFRLLINSIIGTWIASWYRRHSASTTNGLFQFMTDELHSIDNELIVILINHQSARLLAVHKELHLDVI